MLENRKYDQIARSLSVPVEEVLTAISFIKTLEPKPGRQFHNEKTVYITLTTEESYKLERVGGMILSLVKAIWYTPFKPMRFYSFEKQLDQIAVFMP